MFSLQIEDFVYNRGSGTDREIFITIAIIDIMIIRSSSSSSPIIVIKSNLVYNGGSRTDREIFIIEITIAIIDIMIT